MTNYTKYMNYALVTITDRSTQDDNYSKLNVETLFRNPQQADNYTTPNSEIKRYLLRVDDLERFEEFYNHIQDINEMYGEYAIFHINEGFSVDELNRFRTLLNVWCSAKIN